MSALAPPPDPRVPKGNGMKPTTIIIRKAAKQVSKNEIREAITRYITAFVAPTFPFEHINAAIVCRIVISARRRGVTKNKIIICCCVVMLVVLFV